MQRIIAATVTFPSCSPVACSADQPPEDWQSCLAARRAPPRVLFRADGRTERHGELGDHARPAVTDSTGGLRRHSP